MKRQSILLKQFIRDSSKGISLVELLVSMVVASIVMSLALSILVGNRKLYVEDQNRTTVNQNLRAALDLIGTDIKQAGERITDPRFPAVQVIGGTQLLLISKLDVPILPVCQAITASSTTANVSISSTSATPPAGCIPQPDIEPVGAPDGWPDNVGAWRNYRCNQDGVAGCQNNAQEVVRAYIFDGNGFGEFFTYSGENNATRQIQANSGTITWQNAYTTNSSVYLVQTRRYQLTGNRLQLVIDGNTTQNLVNQISTLQVRALVQNVAGLQSTFPIINISVTPNIVTSTWRQLQSLQVDITAQDPSYATTVSRSNATTKVKNLSASGQYFPRNVISR